MRSWPILPLLVLALPACNRDRDEGAAAAADSVAVETPDAVRDLLTPVRSVGLVAVEYGDMGARRARRADVRQYAQTVAADHRALIAVLDSAAQARGTALGETPGSKELSDAVRMAHSGLETLDSSSFDLAFVRAELETHRQLLDRLDQQVLPAVTSPDMRTLVTDTRAMVDAHLTRARQILAALLGQSAEPPPAPVRTTPRPQPQPQTTQPPPTSPAPAPTPPPIPPDTINASR